MSKIKFLIEGIKNFREVGTVTRSGKFLVEKMTQFISPHHKVIFELGAGDGVITRQILKKMPQDSMLFSFEINKNLFKKLEAIDDPRLVAINETVENLEEICQKYDVKEIDTVISAIPFIVFKEEDAKRILTLYKNKMKDKAPWLQIHYATTLKKLYKGVFNNIQTQFVPLNIPPAFVFKCVNNKAS